MIILLLSAFIIGYLAIIMEHTVRVSKTATALVTGVLCWTFCIGFSPDKEEVVTALTHHLGNLSQILFFLLGAMTIVELIDANDGFQLITQRIRTKSKKRLIVIVSVLAFFLSAVLDNLTTAIVMISLVRKLMADRSDRLMFAGAIIISSNAGGAWSPIGDVTTTMLWIGGQVTAPNIMLKLFIPSIVCMFLPVVALRSRMKGDIHVAEEKGAGESRVPAGHRNLIFFAGMGVLLMVPVFKTLTHLPPFMGILAGLGVLWIIIEIIHRGADEDDDSRHSVAHALRRIDTPGILFFLGILLAVSALEFTGQLRELAAAMDTYLKDQNAIVMSIGLLSSIVDNVPLVAAAIGMYPLQQYPTDHYFWEFLAYCTGTGGSLLIIGSAAGVAVMGIERIGFMWYVRKIGWVALMGYLAGAAAYMLQDLLF